MAAGGRIGSPVLRRIQRELAWLSVIQTFPHTAIDALTLLT